MPCEPPPTHTHRAAAPAAEVMERWGGVLARPQLQRYAEAAAYFENAALKARSPLQAVMTLNRHVRQDT